MEESSVLSEIPLSKDEKNENQELEDVSINLEDNGDSITIPEVITDKSQKNENIISLVKNKEQEAEIEVKLEDLNNEDSMTEKNEEDNYLEQEIRSDCLNSNLTSSEVSGDLVQSLVVNIEELLEPLPEHISYKIDSVRLEQFFSQQSQDDLLNTFPLLKMLQQKYVPNRMSEQEFWIRFVWYVHYYNWGHHKQDFIMKEITDDAFNERSEEELLLTEENEEDDEIEAIKLDYHSVDRYIASAILSFLKVFIVCAVLKNYSAPWYYYLYPALWVFIGFLIVLRALQIQRSNNMLKAKLDESREQGIELREIESV